MDSMETPEPQNPSLTMEPQSHSPIIVPQRKTSRPTRTSRILEPKSYAQATEEGLLNDFSPASNGSNGESKSISPGHTQVQRPLPRSNSSNTKKALTEASGDKTYSEVVGDNPQDHGRTPKDRLIQLKEKEAENHSDAPSVPSIDLNHVLEVYRQTNGHSNPILHEIKSTSEAKSNSEISDAYLEKAKNDLTSTKMSDDYQTNLALDEKEKKKIKKTEGADSESEELVSGRKAGQGWGQSSIRYAPLNIPLKRRVQTLVILWHGLSIVGLLSLFLFLCAIPILWPLLMPYLLYCLFSKASTSGQLSHRSDWLRRSRIWSLFASYYPARLYRSVELPPTRKYIFGYHPHGIISNGAFAAFCTEALGFSQLFPGITNTLLTLDSNFRIPIYRDYALAMGLASVSRESCENLLTHGGQNGEGMGRGITIVVGGARESLDAVPNTMRLVLKRRKGFVKLAIRNGADLVPVLGFGENDLFDQVNGISHPRVHKLQLLMKKFLGFTVPLFHARGIFNYDVGLLPYRRPLNIVVGKPIYVQQQKKPEDDYINEVHERYIHELERLWRLHRDTFAPGQELEIAE